VLFGVQAAQAGPLVFVSPETRVSLVEVYSAAGCLSCAEIEQWLHSLVSKQDVWSRFAVVVYHAGHTEEAHRADPYALAVSVRRQNAYVEMWGAERPYTPCFVLNGLEDKTWFQYGAVRNRPGRPAGVLRMEVEDGRIRVVFRPKGAMPAGLDFRMVVLGMGLFSPNPKEVPEYNFAVLCEAAAPLAQLSGEYRVNMSFPAHPPYKEDSLAVAGWVSLPGELEPLQTAGGRLGKAPSP
jgi:hypothetical protein